MNATDQSESPTSVTREAWAELIALERPEIARPPARRAYGRQWQQAGLLVAPIAIAWITLRLLPPSYVSETSFILRHEATPTALPPSGSDLTGVPSESGNADSYAVDDYLLSRDAMAASQSGFPGAGADARYADFRRRVKIDYETSSGVITIRAAASDPRAARALALGLRDAAAGLVERFDRASAASEYLATLAEPDLPDSPAGQDQPLVLLGAAAVGLALAWWRGA